MNPRSPLMRALWLAAGVAVALLFVIFTQRFRLEHLEFVATATETDLAADPASPTGYADGQRQVLIGENDPEGYAWLAQTQTFLSQKNWRIRKTDTDNAPDGRVLKTSSPYRWWLAAVAKGHHLAHPAPLGQNAERAALVGDVWLAVLAVVVALGAIPRWGLVNAGWLALGLALLFPAGDFFSAGEPQNRGLFGLLSLIAVLPLLSGPASRKNSRRLRFLVAGLAAAGAIWIQPSWGVVLLGAIAIAEILTRTLLGFRRGRAREQADSNESAWGFWAIGGAAGSVLAYAIDFAPEAMTSPRLDIVSPLYALLFLTSGAALYWVNQTLSTSPRAKKNWLLVGGILIGAALSVTGCYRAIHQLPGTLFFDPLGHRLALAGHGSFAESLADWIFHQDPSAALLAVLVPSFLILLGLLAVFDSKAGPSDRHVIGLATLLAFAVGACACSQLRMFGWFEWLLLPLFLAVVENAARAWIKHAARALLALACVLGAIAMSGNARATSRTSVSRAEIQALVARDLAEWLNLQAGERGAIVLAAPDLSSELSHFGGLRVVASATPDNQAGLAAATHILFSTSQDEAQASVQRRQVAFIVLATWDSFFKDAASKSGLQLDKTLLGLLESWRPPRWLRPIPYPMPQIAGFEGERVTVFEVVDVQENTVALSHLAEYFAETGQLDAAAAVSHALQTYSIDDLGAAVARIEVTAAAGNPLADSAAWAVVNMHLTDGTPDTLPWDRRVALVAVLAQAKRYDEAKAQLEASMHDADETLLRSLSPRELFRFQSLLRVLHVEETPAMRDAALRRMPAEMRRAFEQKPAP